MPDDYVKCLEKVTGLKEIAAKHLDLKDGDGIPLGMGSSWRAAPALRGLKREEGLKTAYRDMLGDVRPHGAAGTTRRSRRMLAVSEWDQTLQDLLKSFQDLMSLFNYLMLMAGGDVDKVFKWMEYLQERGSLDPDVDLAEFRRQLEEQRIIERLKEGSYALTAKGEQVIRKDSLNQIFNPAKSAGQPRSQARR
jgi:hypothetical protein